LPDNHAHDEFLELCALAASAQLDPEEQKKLDQHLAACPSCREALSQYQAVIDSAIPAFAAAHETDEDALQAEEAAIPAEKQLLDRVRVEQDTSTRKSSRLIKLSSTDTGNSFRFSGAKNWRDVWLLYAAGVLLCVALGVSAYRVGERRGTAVTHVESAPTHPTEEAALEQRLSDLSHERELARSQITSRDQTIADLRLQLKEVTAALKRAAAAENPGRSQANGVRTDNTAKAASGVTTHEADLQTQVQALQAKLTALDRLSANDAARSATLQAEVDQLTEQLHARDATVDQQQNLLAHDRDIRELMGARDLYIAEVYDIGQNGATQKPYGRVFYTKGKSLVFYAYDLDRQSALKNAKAFQAWGRRGPDTQRAVNLGIFYVDDAAKKRWVLKSDDPQKLAQIDAVFVTVEPNGGSHKPSGQPLLFTYLKVDPNHP